MPPRRLPTLAAAALALALGWAATSPAHAQGTVTPGASQAPDPGPVAPPPEFADEARRAYTKGVREARQLIADKRYAEAIAKLDDLLKQRPREPQARFLRTVALAESGKRDEAVAALRDLIGDYPELPEPRNNLAVLLAAKGEYEPARAELALAIASNPDYALARENLGDVYVQLAVLEYERAGKLDARSKTVPAKLKLAREIVGAKPVAAAEKGAAGAPAAAATAPAPAAATASPAATNASPAATTAAPAAPSPAPASVPTASPPAPDAGTAGK